MKIVIDLPKETYKRFIDEWTGTTDVLHAVRHGTPLPKGHWMPYTDHQVCSCCGKWIAYYDNYNYCPNCGARMESEEEE